MAKFLFCLPRYHTNSVPWVQSLKAHGHEVAVHVTSIGSTENHRDVIPLRVRPSWQSRVAMHMPRASRGELRSTPGLCAYAAILQREAPDVVIVRGVTRWFSRDAALAALLQRRRLVIYDQEDATPSSPGTWARRAVFRLVGVGHVTSRLPAGAFPSGAGTAMPLPFGAPHGLLEPDFSSHFGRAPRVLMVAKYRERKGHRALLHALASLKGSCDFTLTFVGEEAGESDRAFCKSLGELAESLGLATRMQFVNNVPHHQMGMIYHDHDLFILPSYNEPAAVSPIEAAWSGCAVLMSRDSGTRGYLPSGREFDFDPGAQDDLASAIQSALRDPAHLKALREQCYLHVSSVAGDETIVRAFERMLA